jgi:hypothetical protein
VRELVALQCAEGTSSTLPQTSYGGQLEKFNTHSQALFSESQRQPDFSLCVYNVPYNILTPGVEAKISKKQSIM